MADTAEAVKKTVEKTAAAATAQAEKVQAAGAKAFREGLDRTTASLSELNAEGKQNLDAMVASAAAAQKGAESLGQQALAYGKTSWESGVAAAQSMAKARSVQELIELQTSYTKSALETYLAEMSKASDVFTASVKDSFKPINERVTATVEKFQAAR
jgi:phasin family protein